MTSGIALDLHADVVTLTAALVNIPSVSFHEQALAEAVYRQLEPLPWLSTTRIGDNIVARTEQGKSERVILAGHLDTVPPADNQRATLVATGDDDGFGFRATEDRLYGLGSCDMKGGLAVMLRCAATIPAPSRDVTYVFYAREEVASRHSGLAEIIQTAPELLTDAACGFLLEPSNAGVEAGCQGTLRAVITVPGRRSHSARSWMGDNAIHRAADVLARLEAYRPAEVEIDGLVYREGLNAVAVDGGIAGNVIPDECTITVNYRFAPSTTVEQAQAHIEDVFSGYQVTIVDSAAGALPGLSIPVVADFLATSGAEAHPKYGWTDVARLSELGIPGCNIGPGNPSVAHAAHEYVTVNDLRAVDSRLCTWLGEQ